MRDINHIRGIVVFYIIAVLMRFLAVKTDILKGIDNEYVLMLLRGCGPALGTLVTVKLFNIPLSLSLKGIYNNFFLPFIVYWVFPVILIGTVTYLLEWKFPVCLLFTVLVYGLLEEIGWRGFLQEQMKHLPKIQSVTIITVLWFVWHLNFDLTVSNLVFLAVLFLGTWGIGKVYSSTSSLLAAAGFHSLNNFFRNGLHGKELLLIAILLICWIGFLIWHKRKKNIILECSKANNIESSI